MQTFSKSFYEDFKICQNLSFSWPKKIDIFWEKFYFSSVNSDIFAKFLEKIAKFSV
jgi:hypothetical protein